MEEFKLTEPILKEIEFENFKGFKNNTSLKINPLTLLSGLNGAGKSTIAQILVILKQSLMTNRIVLENEETPILRLNDHWIKLGEVSDVINDINKKIQFKLTYDDNTKISFSFIPITSSKNSTSFKKEKVVLKLNTFTFEDNNLESAFKINYNNDAWDIVSLRSLSFSDYDFQDDMQAYFKRQYEERNDYKFEEVLNESVQFFGISRVGFWGAIPEHLVINFEDIKNCISEKYIDSFDVNDFKKYIKTKYPEMETETISLRFSVEQCMSYLSAIRGLRYFEPFRGLPQRVYDETDDNNPLDILDQSVSKEVAYKYDFEKKKIISGPIKEAMNYWLNDQFHLAEGYEINELVDNLISEAIIYENGKKFTINNVGFGVSQILPLVSRMLISNNSLIIVDEPECHLHPGLQSKIGEFLLHMCILGKTIIVETHSEHIINILTYYSLKYEDVANMFKSYWIYKDSDSSRIEEIRYDEYGFPQNAPEGFYDETEKIVQALSEIRAKKMMD